MFGPTLSVMVVLWTTVRSEIPTPIIQTTSGPLQGVEETFEGTKYMAFRGIPYAAPPVGDLRFKAPQPPQEWTDVRNVSSYGNPCKQLRKMQNTSEDCLTLNVFTPSNDETNLKPVLVWIHGGGFTVGSGVYYKPQYLVKQDIAVVTINYRLGAQGFLATNTPDATGNWGMKDQVAALKWVKVNIAKFGGDPKQVTIYGESAGAVSVQLHLLSPLSGGLFGKAIISSGSAANNWILKNPDEQVRYSKKLALLLGASEDETEDPHKRVEFLRAADSNNLTKQAQQLINREDSPMFVTLPFAPVIEAPGTEGAFLTENPKKLLAEGKFCKVPMIMSINDLEGSLISLGYSGRNFTPEILREIEQNVCDILPQPLKDAVTAKNECPYVAQQIRDTYFGGKGFDNSNLSFVYLWGDLFILNDVYFSLRTHAKYAGEENPVYSEYFTFDGEWNRLKNGFHFPGAGHGEELSYVFISKDLQQAPLPDSSPEIITKDRMISFITNFVKSGDPTPSLSDLVPVKWLPTGANEISTMVIGNELKMEKEILKTRIGMWDRLNQKYTSNIETEV